MSYINVHYMPGGTIAGWDNSRLPVAQPGCLVTTITVPEGHHVLPDAKLHRIDEDTLELVDLTPAERARSAAPKPFEVDMLIVSELNASDAWFVGDRFLAPTVRDAWIAYRQALRDLSKPQDVESRRLTSTEIILEWPNRPDGVDPTARLRSRMLQS